MARPTKEGLYFFPLDVDLDDKFKLIEAKHGLDGFGIIIKLYQKIYKNSYFLTVTEDWLLLFINQVNVNINVVNDIINDSLKWEIFNQELFNNYSILTSRGIQKKYIEISKRRKQVDFIAEYLLVSDVSSIYPEKVIVNIISINDDINSQRKGKERKGKEKKGNNPQPETEPKPKKFEPKKKDSPRSKSGTFSGNKKQFENLPGIFKDIKSKCDEIISLQIKKPKKKAFNPFGWAQENITNGKHPGAILKVLSGLVLYWETTDSPYGYCVSNLLKYNGNFNADEWTIEQDKMKDISHPELLKLTCGLLKEIPK